MFKIDKFLISKSLYAIRMDSLEVELRPCPEGFNGIDIWHWTMDAVWFRRRKGTTVACTGQLWNYQETEPASAAEALAAATDGRHGADCKARWDGHSIWVLPPQAPDDSDRFTALLRPMLDRYPEIPSGFDGWWKYEH